MQGEVPRSGGGVLNTALFPVHGQYRQVSNPSAAFGAGSPTTGEPFPASRRPSGFPQFSAFLWNSGALFLPECVNMRSCRAGSAPTGAGFPGNASAAASPLPCPGLTALVKSETFAKNFQIVLFFHCTNQEKTSIFCGYIYSLHRVFLQKRMFPAKLTESSQEDNRFFASIGYCISTGNGAATVTLEHDSSSHQNDTPTPPPVTASRWG